MSRTYLADFSLTHFQFVSVNSQDLADRVRNSTELGSIISRSVSGTRRRVMTALRIGFVRDPEIWAKILRVVPDIERLVREQETSQSNMVPQVIDSIENLHTGKMGELYDATRALITAKDAEVSRAHRMWIKSETKNENLETRLRFAENAADGFYKDAKQLRKEKAEDRGRIEALERLVKQLQKSHNVDAQRKQIRQTELKPAGELRPAKRERERSPNYQTAAKKVRLESPSTSPEELTVTHPTFSSKEEEKAHHAYPSIDDVYLENWGKHKAPCGFFPYDECKHDKEKCACPYSHHELDYAASVLVAARFHHGVESTLVQGSVEQRVMRPLCYHALMTRAGCKQRDKRIAAHRQRFSHDPVDVARLCRHFFESGKATHTVAALRAIILRPRARPAKVIAENDN